MRKLFLLLATGIMLSSAAYADDIFCDGSQIGIYMAECWDFVVPYFKQVPPLTVPASMMPVVTQIATKAPLVVTGMVGASAGVTVGVMAAWDYVCPNVPTKTNPLQGDCSMNQRPKD